MEDPSLIQFPYYYRFCLLQALNPDFAESSAPSRINCHARSASPCNNLLARVCGITSASPVFESVQKKPAPGNLKFCEANMPHPMGTIALTAEIKEIIFKSNQKQSIECIQ
jgi:hypothetical protein